MAQLIPNEFSSYNLTEQEALQGSILTTLQKQVIQNLRANAAMERIHLKYDSTKHDEFIQQEASLQGQLDILNFLLDASIASEDANLNLKINTTED